MCTGRKTLGTAEKQVRESKTRKQDVTVPRKMSPAAQNIKTGPTTSVPSKTSSGAQKMKMGPDALGTAKNESWSAKHQNGTRCPRYRRKQVRAGDTLKRDPTHSVPPKNSPGAQNMKTGQDTVGTVKNEYGAQNMKTGPHALETAENESGSAKHENGT
jgi:hypothetical protein